jgi:hypothetical protein
MELFLLTLADALTDCMIFGTRRRILRVRSKTDPIVVVTTTIFRTRTMYMKLVILPSSPAVVAALRSAVKW